MATAKYQVEGMTCDHCSAAVEKELTALPGISSVDVQLEGGTVTVHGDAIDDQKIRDAVDDAGFYVAG